MLLRNEKGVPGSGEGVAQEHAEVARMNDPSEALQPEQVEALKVFDTNPRKSFQVEDGPVVYLSDLCDLAAKALRSETPAGGTAKVKP
jgi:hypothetical protein